MTTNTTILDARTALALTIANAGVKCIAYERADYPTQMGGEVSLQGFDTTDGVDQRIAFTKLNFAVRIYQQLAGNWEAAIGYLETAMTTTMEALSADSTLGGKVVTSELLGAQFTYTSLASGGQVATCELRVDVTPFRGGQ